jgi:nucleoside-diphosphate-sugar epimerase
MILLTGASGFIGKHLLTALIKKYGDNNIVALTSKPIKECCYLLHNSYDFSIDFFFENDYGSIDTIIHAGAFTPKNSFQANDWKLSNQNVINTQKLLEANLPKLQKFIYLSTLDVYGNSDVISEETLIAPASLYGHSKYYVECLVTEWARFENKISQILRIGHVYGPGEEAYQKIIPVTMKKIALGDVVEIWGDGHELRSFIYIDDAVKAIIRSLDIEHFIGPINLVSNNSVSIKELVNKIITISGKKVKVQMIPALTHARDLVFNNLKMQQYLGSSETSLESGLAREWEYTQSLIS